ncbi:DUF2127 domain-containing protein [Granulicella tundricola]|uniref:DUF2127 domain-containing protein n=1 Tax=Granulicella tundricola (strain ATCC BAA-1859 / DSM 23138 / MP5ACTX9) TaxID=1198114 RepID=E8WXA5_GRATM|nr:DUF2127 domain-containing protein [Granulicella tundricola]ADW69747.1 hypothetical protein AciX9_2723 [Granulicella tundricola MP5ACTX9]
MSNRMSEEVLQNERETEAAATEDRPSLHDNGLLLIGLFKLSKALFFFCAGLGVIHFMNKNLSDEVIRLAMALKRDPEGRIVQLLLEKVDLVDAHTMRRIEFFTFGYSGLALTEGIGLLLKKVWAEYLTLLLTISFLPWELFELVRRASLFRFGLLATNLAVLGYLIWLLQRKKQSRVEAADRE